MTCRAILILLILLIGQFPVRADDDAIKMNLMKAKSAFDSAMESYRQAVVAYLEKKEEEARRIGDKKLVDQLKGERLAFEEKGEWPRNFPADLKKKERAARTAMEAAYAAAIKEYTKARKDDEATAADKELDKFLAVHGIDLLEHINPKVHAVHGDWKRTETGLLSPKVSDRPRIVIPYEPGEEYDLTLGVKRLPSSSPESFMIGLAGGGKQFIAIIDGWPKEGFRSGMSLSASDWQLAVLGQRLLPNVESRVKCSVRRGEVIVAVDGKQLLQFKGDLGQVGHDEQAYGVPNKKALFVAVYSLPKSATLFQISDIRVYPITGKGKLLK